MELEVTWQRTLRIWWAFTWRGFLYVMLPCMLLGGIIGAYMGVNNIPIEAHAWKIQVLSFLIAVPLGIWVIKIVLSTSFPQFRIALIQTDAATTLPRDSDSPSTEAAATPRGE